MKFLLALAILMTSTAFAQRNHKQIKCYESAQQNGSSSVAYVLEERGRGGQVIHVKYPEDLKGALKWDGECLSHPSNNDVPAFEPKDRLSLCPSEGQEIRGLVPVEAYIGDEDEGTVYCERSILDWFEVDLEILK